MVRIMEYMQPRQLVMLALALIILFGIVQPLFSYEGLHGSLSVDARLGGLHGGFSVEGFENETGPMFVMFYSPHCGWCHKMMPEMDALIAQYQTDSRVKVVKIDCDADKNIAEAQKVQGFPTLRYYPAGLSGSYDEYSGERTKAHMETFITSKL